MEDSDSLDRLHIERVRHQTFVQTQNTCPLCNSALTIKVQSYDDDLNLREEATCPKCRVLARVKDHRWH